MAPANMADSVALRPEPVDWYRRDRGADRNRDEQPQATSAAGRDMRGSRCPPRSRRRCRRRRGRGVAALDSGVVAPGVVATGVVAVGGVAVGGVAVGVVAVGVVAVRVVAARVVAVGASGNAWVSVGGTWPVPVALGAVDVDRSAIAAATDRPTPTACTRADPSSRLSTRALIATALPMTPTHRPHLPQLGINDCRAQTQFPRGVPPPHPSLHNDIRFADALQRRPSAPRVTRCEYRFTDA